jgi:hypothetical protein
VRPEDSGRRRTCCRGGEGRGGGRPGYHRQVESRERDLRIKSQQQRHKAQVCHSRIPQLHCDHTQTRHTVPGSRRKQNNRGAPWACRQTPSTSVLIYRRFCRVRFRAQAVTSDRCVQIHFCDPLNTHPGQCGRNVTLKNQYLHAQPSFHACRAPNLAFCYQNRALTCSRRRSVMVPPCCRPPGVQERSTRHTTWLAR